ncbi:MAG TPA: hypothetical protein VI138_05325 [Candidatus Dormibacteraeota bacterium]
MPYPGFVTEKGSKNNGVISNKTAAAGDNALLRRYQREGRRSGYLATFDREVSPQAVVGPVVIESSAVTYSTATGAQGGLGLEDHQLLAEGWTPVSTGTLGQGAEAFTETKALDQTQFQSFVLNWRQGNVDNEIRIAGNAATLDLTYALTLGRVQERAEVSK